MRAREVEAGDGGHDAPGRGAGAGSGTPSYGFLLALAGVLLASYANWLVLIGVPALAGFLYRIRVEEH